MNVVSIDDIGKGVQDLLKTFGSRGNSHARDRQLPIPIPGRRAMGPIARHRRNPGGWPAGRKPGGDTGTAEERRVGVVCDRPRCTRRPSAVHMSPRGSLGSPSSRRTFSPAAIGTSGRVASLQTSTPRLTMAGLRNIIGSNSRSLRLRSGDASSPRRFRATGDDQALSDSCAFVCFSPLATTTSRLLVLHPYKSQFENKAGAAATLRVCDNAVLEGADAR
jgi:hypothetical protein